MCVEEGRAGRQGGEGHDIQFQKCPSPLLPGPKPSLTHSRCRTNVCSSPPPPHYLLPL